jgi:uncharacterized membrane protein
MNNQSIKSSASSNTTDVSATESKTEPDKLVIPSRKIIESDKLEDNSVDKSAHLDIEATSSNSIRPTTAPTLRPITDEVQPAKVTPEDSANNKKVTSQDSASQTIDVKVTTSPAKNNKVDQQAPATPQANIDVDTLAEPSTVVETAKNDQKELEKLELDKKRQQQIDEVIKNHQYFVPIDSVARKKSIKVSLLLTVLAIIFAGLLIDLLLDSGAILLVQKIPHTHFFSNNLNN